MDSKMLVLIIEDEINISDFMRKTLQANQYRVTCAKTGKEGLELFASCRPDVVLLDLGLPDMDGMDIIRQVRQWSGTPLIVISARTQEKEKVEALDIGADDYITKPFGTSELLARIRTELRHRNAFGQASSGTNAVFRAKDLRIDFEKRKVTVREQEVHLTQVEYKIVCFLARNSGRVMTYDAIITEVWGPFADDDNRILRVNMANIRRKLEQNPGEPQYIFTEIGIGYRMTEEI